MANQIIKQPNGLYCIWSTVVDHITCYHMTRDALVEEFLSVQRERIETEVDRKLAQLEKGEKPYYQFTMTYEEALEQVAERHDQATADEQRVLMEKPSEESVDG